MEIERLNEIIKSGESQDIEFKQSLHSSQDISKLMCGFANTFGGVLVVGVNSKSEVVGLKKDLDFMQQRISSAAQAVSPPLMPSVELHEIKGKKVIVAVVQKAIDGAFHTFQGVLYARVGSTLKKMEGTQILEFLRGKNILCYDETLTQAGIEQLDELKIRGYLSMRKQTDYLQKHSVLDFLRNMELAKPNGELLLKNTASMFFAKDPIRFHPQMELKLVRFDGTEPIKIVSHELVQSNPIEAIDKAVSFLKSNIPKKIEVGEDARRREKYEIPLDAVREAVVNAVAHRDYFSKDSIQAYLFTDRLEITNPGSIPADLPRELFGTLSVQRNPLTYRILRDFGYIEGLGSGIPRMINAMREAGLEDPEFGIYARFFRITLKNNKDNNKPVIEYEDLNERQIRALKFLEETGILKTKNYMEINKVSYFTAIKDIKIMIDKKFIQKKGKYRGAYYTK